MSDRVVRQDNSMNRPNSSMQLTRAADYAVRVMIQLASLPPDARVSLPSLARATGAPESFLSKVLQGLARSGLISSQRGQSGGFRIAPRGRQASMLQVIEAIDGAICLNVCLMHGRSCPRKARCPAHPVWDRAQQAMLQVLSGVSIAAMAAQESPAKPGHSASGVHVLALPAKATRR
ncbi:MAG: Rrf2 family transcriptional regulator [Terracidiphilus sp.]